MNQDPIDPPKWPSKVEYLASPLYVLIMLTVVHKDAIESTEVAVDGCVGRKKECT